MTYIQNTKIKELVETYQTPLYVMDETQIRSQCALFNDAFKHPYVSAQVIYASKAFLTVAMAQLINQEGLYMDCVSPGELYTAKQAGFPMAHVVLHGNNKQYHELKDAIDSGVGLIVIDNEKEANEIMKLSSNRQKQRVMMRINLGIEAHTHDYINTAKLDSKFGMSMYDQRLYGLLKKLDEHAYVDFVGFHSHVGSQIMEPSTFVKHAESMMAFVKQVTDDTGIKIKEINLGGGFGIQYLKADQPVDLSMVLPEILDMVYQCAMKHKVNVPRVYIEPGRSIVGKAGYTLYTVGQVKETHQGKKYLMVDGSMADHMRTALYQAAYDAFIDRKATKNEKHHYIVAGRACESGDILIHDLILEDVKSGDILVVESTGAYHYSMASHYNRLTKPAVVFVNDKGHRLVVKRETFEDLIRHDLKLED